MLTTASSPVRLSGLFHELPGMWAVFDRVLEAFRSGGGVPLDAYPDAWWDGMERFTANWFEHLLLDEWVPLVDGMHDALRSGAHVADVGCGRGRALVTLLQAYPKATAVGYDLSEAQLEGARRNADEAGVADRVRFVNHDAAQGLDDTFDIVTTFDVAHDLVDPGGVFRAVHRALRPGGSYLLLDFRVGDQLEDNVTRNAAMFYGWSLAYCLTTSLARGGAGLGTCGLPESEVRTRLHRAGFASVHVVPFEDPFNVLYQARP